MIQLVKRLHRKNRSGASAALPRLDIQPEIDQLGFRFSACSTPDLDGLRLSLSFRHRRIPALPGCWPSCRSNL